MYQSPTLYGKRVTLLFIGITCLGIILCVAAGTNSVIGSMGAALFLGVMTAALVIDWSGVITLRGLTDWSHLHGKKRFWLIVAWVFLFPVFFCIYLVRVAMHQFSSSALPSPAPAPKKVRVGLVIGSLVVCIGLISAFGSANGATANPTARVVVAATPTDTPSLAQNTSTQIPTATRPTPTYQVQPTPTSTSVPTQPPGQYVK